MKFLKLSDQPFSSNMLALLLITASLAVLQSQPSWAYGRELYRLSVISRPLDPHLNQSSLVNHLHTNKTKIIVPKNVTIISHIHHFKPSQIKRSDTDGVDDDESQSSLFKSLIPKSIPFKKPIKKIFRSWFEPEPEALNEDSTASTFYFTRPKANLFQSTRNLASSSNLDSSSSSIPQSSHVLPTQPAKHSNFVNRVQYSYANHDPYGTANSINAFQHRSVVTQRSQPQFAIGDPDNGRGLTISFGDNAPQSSEPTTYTQQTAPSEQPQQYSQQPAISIQQPESNQGSRGLSLSFGRGQGSGLSFNFGRGEGRGIALSFGGGGGGGEGGSGISFNLGGGGGSGGGGEGSYKQSGSSTYPSYYGAGGYGGSYSSYGNSYGGYNNYDYYPPKPLFSLVMPSMGKTVMEMNNHPPKLKMKINSSPKVKITTNTKDPLDKPGLEDEPIQDDIFGPPAPFEKREKSNATANNGTMAGGHNMTMSNFNQTMFPYMYPYYPYAHLYQYPYNYYYNYYQQYPYYNMMNMTSMTPMTMYPTPQYMTQPMAQSPMAQPVPQAISPPPPPPPSPPMSSTYPQMNPPSYHSPTPVKLNGQINPPPSMITYTPAASNPNFIKNYQTQDLLRIQPTATQVNSPITTTMVQTQYVQQQPSSVGQTQYVQPSSQAQGQMQSTQQLYGTSYSQASQVWQPSPTSQSSNQKQPMNNMYQVPQMQVIDNNNIGTYKRSSASRNYQKDMLTLSTNSISSKASSSYYAKTNRKPIYSMKRTMNTMVPMNNLNNFGIQTVQTTKYTYVDPMQTSASYKYPQYGMRIMTNMVNYTNPMVTSASAVNYNYYQYPQYVAAASGAGTGVGYSFYNTSNQYMNGNYSWSPYNYYYNPYYMSYYNNYYNYAKKYYDTYYGNYSSYYKKNKTSITGYNQNSFDYEQSKIFGSRTIKYPGGSTKEEKARVIFDVRPRVTLKMLNKTEQMMQDEELKKKKKDHIFKTHMEVIMESTTTAKPYYKSYYDSYYGYNYGPEEDDFGWTHEPPYATTTTPKPKPKTTTTRRRTTTTEAPSSQEFSDEENGTSEATSGEDVSTEEGSSTTTESSDVDIVSEENDDETSQEATTTSAPAISAETEETEPGTEEEVIEGTDEESKEDNAADQDVTEEKVEDDNNETTNKEEEGEKDVEEEQQKTVEDNGLSAKVTNATVAPELVAAMIRALQEALGVTTTTTTPMPPISTTKPLNENGDFDDHENDITSKHAKSTKPKSKVDNKPGRRRLPTNVISTTVRNTTQLRLKTPVLSIQSKTTPAPAFRSRIKIPTFAEIMRKPRLDAEHDLEPMVTRIEEITTTSPFIINRVTKSNDVKQVIDGDALLNNFDVNNLSDDERREMLTNILSVIQNKSTDSVKQNKVNIKQPSKTKKGKTKNAKLIPATKANNVKIISSLDELNSGSVTSKENKSTNNNNQPIYVVLLPQNKKKK